MKELTDSEIDVAMWTLMGWKKIRQEYRNWDGPKTQDWVGERQKDCRQILHSYVSGKEARYYAVESIDKLLDGWGQIDQYMATLYRLAQDPHICQTSHAWAYLTAPARLQCIALLKVVKPEIFWGVKDPTNPFEGVPEGVCPNCGAEGTLRDTSAFLVESCKCEACGWEDAHSGGAV